MNRRPRKNRRFVNDEAGMAFQARVIKHADIIAALGRQLECYRRLSKLAARQREHVQQSDMESLLSVLAQRQAVMDELVPLEKVLSAVKQDWASFAAGLSDEARQQAESLLAESRKLLEQITRADQDDVMILQQRKLNMGRQLSQSSAQRQVNRAYAAAAYGRAPAQTDVLQ